MPSPGHGEPGLLKNVVRFFRLHGPPRPSKSGQVSHLEVRATVPGTRPDVTESFPRKGEDPTPTRVLPDGTESALGETKLAKKNPPPRGPGTSKVGAATKTQCVDEHPREISNPTLRRAWPRDLPGAAICVQDVDVQCVLQFTLIHAAGCALHRHTSRVIHRLELSVTAKQQRFRFPPPRGPGSRRERLSPSK